MRTPSSPVFLSSAQLHALTEEIAEILPDAALAGGYAMQLYGSDRMTTDIDVLSDHIPVTVRSKKTLLYGGVSMLSAEGILIDIIVRNDDQTELYEYALENAVRVAGVPLRILRPTDLAVIKLAAAREKDQGDLLFLIRKMTPEERVTTRAVVKKFMGWFGAEEFDSFVHEVQWRSQRDRPLRRSRR